MRRFLTIFLLFCATPALAVTQATKVGRLNYALTRAGMPSSQSGLFLAGTANVLYYDTYAELAAASPTEGIIGYAIDTNNFYLRSGASWVGLPSTASFAGENGGTFDNAADNAWTFGENSEDLVLTASANLWTLSSSTSATFAFTPAVAFAATITSASGAGALTFSNTAASIVLNDNDASALDIGAAGATSLLRVGTLDAGGSVTISGTAGQTSFSVPVGESSFVEGIAAPIVASSLDSLRFCGNGSNATTPVYMAPVLIGTAYAANMEFGGAACDGAESTTEATADAVWNSLVFKPVAMTCVIVGVAAGNNDVVTFQLRDDTADVSGMSCTVTMDGAVAKQCTVRDASPATVALGSTVAVKIVAATDDDLSTADAECRVTVAY